MLEFVDAHPYITIFALWLFAHIAIAWAQAFSSRGSK